MPSQPAPTCECGHGYGTHQRIVIEVFPCEDCSCGDYAQDLTDDETCADVDSILGEDD